MSRATRCKSSGISRFAARLESERRMKLFSLILPLALLPTMLTAQAAKPADAGQLDAVLKKMDALAATFDTAQAEFESDRYEKVIDEVDDVQKGTIYYRRVGKELEMKMDIKQAGDSV